MTLKDNKNNNSTNITLEGTFEQNIEDVLVARIFCFYIQ